MPAHLFWLQTCVSILTDPSQPWVNVIGYMTQCSSTMIYRGSMALYTLKAEFARWTKSDKKGRLCAISKTGKLNKNLAQMRLAGEKNKAMVILVASVAYTSQCEVYLRRAAIATANAAVYCQTFKTIGCTSFRQSSTKWDPIVSFIHQSAALVFHLL